MTARGICIGDGDSRRSFESDRGGGGGCNRQNKLSSILHDSNELLTQRRGRREQDSEETETGSVQQPHHPVVEKLRHGNVELAAQWHNARGEPPSAAPRPIDWGMGLEWDLSALKQGHGQEDGDSLQPHRARMQPLDRSPCRTSSGTARNLSFRLICALDNPTTDSVDVFLLVSCVDVHIRRVIQRIARIGRNRSE